jgi:hypothetical protein
MMRAALSSAAAQLLRSLLSRTGLDRDRVLVSAFRSVDWQSLTFTGERHEISLRIPGPCAAQAAALLREGLAEAEWSLKGHIVAEIVIVREYEEADGAILVGLEALTLSD